MKNIHNLRPGYVWHVWYVLLVVLSLRSGHAFELPDIPLATAVMVAEGTTLHTCVFGLNINTHTYKPGKGQDELKLAMPSGDQKRAIKAAVKHAVNKVSPFRVPKQKPKPNADKQDPNNAKEDAVIMDIAITGFSGQVLHLRYVYPRKSDVPEELQQLKLLMQKIRRQSD